MTNTKCNSYKYKDWNCLEIFRVFYLIVGQWVGGWWVGGRPVGGSGVSGRWVAGGPVGGTVVGCQWVGLRPVGGSIVGGRWVGGLFFGGFVIRRFSVSENGLFQTINGLLQTASLNITLLIVSFESHKSWTFC